MRAVRNYRVTCATVTMLLVILFTLSLTANGSPASSSSSQFGAPLKVYETSLAHPIWVRWDKASCKFVPAAAPYPGPYKAVLRGPGHFTGIVGWTPQDTVTDNLVLANNSFDTAAKAAGINLRVISNNFPDPAQPLKAVNDMVTLKPAVVLSMNVISQMQDRIFQLYQQACIPAVSFAVAPPNGVPFLAGSWSDAGAALAEVAAKQIQLKQWPVSTVDVDICVNAIFVGGPAESYTSFKQVLQQKVAGLTGANFFQSDCTVGTGSGATDAAQRSTTDWLTAHPTAQHIVMFGAADVSGIGMYNALEAAGRGGQGMVFGIGLTKPVRALLLKQDPTYVASIDFGLFFYGQYGIAVAQDIIDGRPIPEQIVQPLRVVGAENIKQVLRERGTTE